MALTLHEAADIIGAKRDPDLKWREMDDLPYGWVIHFGYSVEWDDGRAQVWIHRALLNTGQREVELSLKEMNQDDLRTEELSIAEQEESDAEAAALSLADNDDKGDWLYEQRKDRGL